METDTELDELLARLSAAGQERDELREERDGYDVELRRHIGFWEAAEARVEAAEQALRDAHEFLCGCEQPGKPTVCVQSEAFDYLSELDHPASAVPPFGAALATVGASGPTRDRQCLDDSHARVGASSAPLAVAALLRDAIEDAMVLREEAPPNDGLAAGLVATLEHIDAALAGREETT